VDPPRVRIITGREHWGRYTADQKLRLVEEAMLPSRTVSAVARMHGVSPSLLFGWRRRMSEGGKAAIKADDEVVAASHLRELEGRIRDLERLLGRKTMEVEILREAVTAARGKARLAVAAATVVDPLCGSTPVKVVAETLGVARSSLVEQVRGPAKPCGRYKRQGDEEVLAGICQLTDARSAYGYRRITALLKRARRASGAEPLNHKKGYRLMAQGNLLLQRYGTQRPVRVHEGSVIAPASNLAGPPTAWRSRAGTVRWCA
jgi:transposase